MSDKQEWVYTDDGPVLDDKKTVKNPKIKLRKSYFVLPWIFLAGFIIYAFSSDEVALGILIVVFGPITVLMINAYTFYYLAIRPLKKMANQGFSRNPKIQR